MTRLLINDVQYTRFDAFLQLEKNFVEHLDGRLDDDEVEEE